MSVRSHEIHKLSVKRTLTVFFPIPVPPPIPCWSHRNKRICLFGHAPVTRMTLLVRSGMSSTPHVGGGRKACFTIDNKPPMLPCTANRVFKFVRNSRIEDHTFKRAKATVVKYSRSSLRLLVLQSSLYLQSSHIGCEVSLSLSHDRNGSA